MAVGLATNCKIHQYCKFDRKNYSIRIIPRIIRFLSFISRCAMKEESRLRLLPERRP